jgi:hypothetical protein
MYKHYQEWNENAPRGLLLIGFGASLLGEAIVMKSHKKSFWKWFGLGTIALIVLNSGVSIFAEATKQRALYEMKLSQPSEK